MRFQISKHFPNLILVLCLVLFGCEQSDPIGAVKGRVTFQGEPVPEGTVQFSDAGKGVYISAPIQDGTYTVKSEKGAGLPLGKYTVVVVPPIPQIVTGQPIPPPKSYDNIPARYRDPTTSGLNVDVKSGGVTYDIEMQP